MYSTATPSLNHLLILDIWRSFTTDIKARFKFPFFLFLQAGINYTFFYGALLENPGTFNIAK